jgi:hypothetical protein
VISTKRWSKCSDFGQILKSVTTDYADELHVGYEKEELRILVNDTA